MDSAISRVKFIGAAVLTAALLMACNRRNNPLLSTPDAGTTSAVITSPEIDAHDIPFNRVFVQVLGGGTTPIQNFQLGNFSLVENGRPTVPDAVGPVTDPLYVVLAIDRSGSMVMDAAGQPDPAKENAANTAGKDFVTNHLGAGDQMAIIEFANSSVTSVPFTSDQTTLFSVLGSSRSSGGTALYDAALNGAGLLRSVTGRKLLIVLTDGVDNASSHHINDAVDGINTDGVSAFMVGLGADADTAALTTIAGGTGGTYNFSSNGSDLTPIFNTILSHMQNLVYVKYRKRADSGTLTVYLNYGSITGSTTRRF